MNKLQSAGLQSFSMPFFSLHEVRLEQPVFAANYIQGKVTAQQNGEYRCMLYIQAENSVQVLKDESQW